MVHVLTEVLRKVHQSLRSNGYLLITQPTPTDERIDLEIDSKVVLSEIFHEYNFRKYLGFTLEAIQNVLDEHLFITEQEETAPKEGYHCNEYLSVDEWVEDYEDSCEDLEELYELAAKLRKAANGREHRIIDQWKESWLLLRKTQPETSNL